MGNFSFCTPVHPSVSGGGGARDQVAPPSRKLPWALRGENYKRGVPINSSAPLWDLWEWHSNNFDSLMHGFGPAANCIQFGGTLRGEDADRLNFWTGACRWGGGGVQTEPCLAWQCPDPSRGCGRKTRVPIIAMRHSPDDGVDSPGEPRASKSNTTPACLTASKPPNRDHGVCCQWWPGQGGARVGLGSAGGDWRHSAGWPQVIGQTVGTAGPIAKRGRSSCRDCEDQHEPDGAEGQRRTCATVGVTWGNRPPFARRHWGWLHSRWGGAVHYLTLQIVHGQCSTNDVRSAAIRIQSPRAPASPSLNPRDHYYQRAR